MTTYYHDIVCNENVQATVLGHTRKNAELISVYNPHRLRLWLPGNMHEKPAKSTQSKKTMVRSKQINKSVKSA